MLRIHAQAAALAPRSYCLGLDPSGVLAHRRRGSFVSSGHRLSLLGQLHEDSKTMPSYILLSSSISDSELNPQSVRLVPVLDDLDVSATRSTASTPDF
jgi:hypothetical protein